MKIDEPGGVFTILRVEVGGCDYHTSHMHSFTIISVVVYSSYLIVFAGLARSANFWGGSRPIFRIGGGESSDFQDRGGGVVRFSGWGGGGSRPIFRIGGETIEI